MKKMNKKGFTLAELLIVIAIIAILIAIAIPAFGGALDNARLQTDHANMRSAYAMAQVANIDGGLYLDNSGSKTELTAGTTYYFTASGSVSDSDANACTLKSAKHTAANTNCAASATCKAMATGDTVSTTTKITIQYNATSGLWEVKLV